MNALPISIVTSDDFFPPEEQVCIDCMEEGLPDMLCKFAERNDEGLIETVLPPSITRKLLDEISMEDLPGDVDFGIRYAFHRAVVLTMSLKLNSIAKTFTSEGYYHTIFELLNVLDIERTSGLDEFASWIVSACWTYLTVEPDSVFPDIVAITWHSVDGPEVRWATDHDSEVDDADEK